MGINNSVGFYPHEMHIWLAGAEIPKDIHSPLQNAQHRFTVSQVNWVLDEDHEWLLSDVCWIYSSNGGMALSFSRKEFPSMQ